MWIFLIGFMGSGKSFLLKKCQKGFPPGISDQFFSVDLDQEILVQWGSGEPTLGHWIKNKGWEEFRRRETLVLQGVFRHLRETKPPATVVALGGGTLREETLPLFMALRREGPVSLVWLDTPFETCYQRIKAEGEEKRPLLSLGKNQLEDLYRHRERFYSQCDYRLGVFERERIQGFPDLVTNLAKGHNDFCNDRL